MTYEIRYIDTHFPGHTTISSVRQFKKAVREAHIVPGSAFKRAKKPLSPLLYGDVDCHEQLWATSEEYRRQYETIKAEAIRLEAKWEAANPWVPIQDPWKKI